MRTPGPPTTHLPPVGVLPCEPLLRLLARRSEVGAARSWSTSRPSRGPARRRRGPARAADGPALRGMPAARACHRRQLFLLRRRSPDHRAAARTWRPTRSASGGLAAFPAAGNSTPAAMPRPPEIAATIKSGDAQDSLPILVTGRTERRRAPGRPRTAAYRLGYPDAPPHRRHHRAPLRAAAHPGRPVHHRRRAT